MRVGSPTENKWAALSLTQCFVYKGNCFSNAILYINKNPSVYIICYVRYKVEIHKTHQIKYFISISIYKKRFYFKKII